MLVAGCCVTAACASQTCEIELQDGNKIRGALVSFLDGVYTVHSDSLGNVDIDSKEVIGIRTVNQSSDGETAQPGLAPGPSVDSGNPPETIKDRMTSDADTMKIINSLQDDPDFLALMKDPRMLEAVKSGDVKTLSANPAFMKILASPRVKEIQDRVLTPQ